MEGSSPPARPRRFEATRRCARPISVRLPMLEVRDLHAYYGKSHVLHGVTLDVREGEIVSLLGRNGVGRSTTVKAIMGQVAARGVVNFRGEDIAGLKPYQVARRGMGYVPEDRAIFPDLTVRENLELGRKGHGEPNP